MRNLLLGFLIGLLTATGAGVWAQSTSGSVFTYGDTGFSTFNDFGSGTTGTIYTYPGTGMSSYQDSTGRTGSIFTFPGTGMTTYQFSGGHKPC
jgi:hypothetical protein